MRYLTGEGREGKGERSENKTGIGALCVLLLLLSLVVFFVSYVWFRHIDTNNEPLRGKKTFQKKTKKNKRVKTKLVTVTQRTTYSIKIT